MEAVAFLNPKKILLAFDADKNKEVSTSTNPDARPFAVAKTLSSLYLALREKGHNVVIEDWNAEDGKGIDDVLAAGFSDRIREMSGEEAKSFVVAALQDEMPLNWIYIIGTKRFIELENMQELDKEQFSDKYAAEIKGSPHTKVLKHPGFPKVDSPIYEPGEKPIMEKGDLKFFNFWRPSELEPEEGDVSPFLKHCEYILPDDHERSIMLDFLAYNIQKPGKKIHWALLLQGVQGTGKSYFGSVMRLCLGEDNVSNPSNEAIHEAFTGWQKRCQLVVIEELMAKGRLELMNKLKPMITQPISIIREMYRPPYEQPNRFNLLLFTNHEDAIIIDETDRRYCVLYSKAEPKDGDYYTRLWDWTGEHAGRILHFLQKRDLAAFRPHAHAPMTEGKEQLIIESRPALQQWMRDCIETETWPFNGDVIASNHLMECLPKHLQGSHPNAINKALKQAGAVALKQVKLPTGYARLLAVRRHKTWLSVLELDKADQKLIFEYEKNNTSANASMNPMRDSSPM